MEATKHYYYIDPLKAAWMAREFGVEFFWELSRMDGLKLIDRYVVHPDSLHIFEPMEGDVVFMTALGGGFGVGLYNVCLDGEDIYDNHICISNIKSKDSVMESGDMWGSLFLGEIVQRNNKAFFMPETEA